MHVNALDLLNFFLSDVRGGLGPYVNVLLITEAHWSQFMIGAVLTTSGLLGIMAHPTIGAFIDQTRAKREAIVFGAFLLSGCALAIVRWPIVPIVLIADIIMALLGGLFAPAIAALTLGLCPREDLALRLGRNAGFDRAGNVSIAVMAGIIGVSVSQKAPFYLVPFFAMCTAAAALSIPGDAIDNGKARGLEEVSAPNGPQEHPADWRTLITYRPLVIFSAAAALFHFANAPIFPLVAQRLALANVGWETGLTSLSIIMAQFVAMLMATLVTRANKLGRKPLLTLAFFALLLRGGLCIWFGDSLSLLVLQALDGAGGGLFDALLPLILADLMKGTGRYSLARGAVSAIQGVGGSLSQVVAGFIVTSAGYGAAFFVLSAVALAGLLIVTTLFSETGKRDPRPFIGAHRN